MGRWSARLALMASLLLLSLAPRPGTAGDLPHVYIATYRGCEEVCQAFQQHLHGAGIEATYTVRNAERDAKRFAAMVEEVKQVRPDLLVTWGTAATLAMVGAHDGVDPARHVTDIPTVYLYVADPVGARIVAAKDRSNRPNVAGANINVPYGDQIRVVSAYRPVKRIGMIYGTNEPNSVSEATSLRAAAEAAGLEVVEELLPLDEHGRPSADSIVPAVAQLVRRRPDFLMYVSSSFMVANIEHYTATAVAAGLPLFTYAELPITKGHALVALYSPLRNIGAAAAIQAAHILRGADPASLPTTNLSRFSLVVNMEVAHRLHLYPPIQLLRFATLIKSR